MAKITKGMIKAHERAQKEYEIRYRNVMKKIRVPILFRIGIMNFLASEEMRNLEDLIEGRGEEMQEALKGVKVYTLANDVYVETAYKKNPETYRCFADACNHAYGEVEDVMQEMKTVIRDRLSELGNKDADLHAQISIVTFAIHVAAKIFGLIRRKTLAKHKVDVMQELKCMDYNMAIEPWEEFVRKFGCIDELEHSLDMFEVEGFRGAYDKFIEITGRETFLDDCCKWAVTANKEYMPETYEAIMKEEDKK